MNGNRNNLGQLLTVLTFLVLSVTLAQGQTLNPRASAPTAFTHVSVIPMDAERVLEDYSVIVHGDQIVAMGPAAEVEVPETAIIIDGTGHFLLPGLVDMHVHMHRPTDPVLFIVNGVTTVRMMWGSQRGLEWRQQIARGERLGPTLFTSGPILEGHPPAGYEDVIPITGKILLTTREEAISEVARQKAAGYDFIKVYNNLSGDVYEGLVDAAKTHGMPVVGHVPVDVGVYGVFAAGQHTIEHLRGYSNALVPPEAPIQPGPDYRSRELSWQFGNVSKTATVAAATRDADVYSTPTLMVQIYSMPQHYVDRFLSAPEAVFMHPMLRRGLEHREKMRWLSFAGGDFEGSKRGYPVKQALVRGLRDAGAKILAGSDLSPLGFTLHAELQNLVEAGLTPFEALQAATRTAAEALGESEVFGTIAVGKRADLLLLQKNPLIDIANTGEIDGVMLRGKWFSTDKLEGLFREIRSSLPTLATLDKGVALARKGDIEAAKQTIEGAIPIDSGPIETVGYWNSLCWYGSIWGHAEDVVAACERAVAEAPENGDPRDSRGITRALLGDFRGAIDDLEAYVDWTIITETKAERLQWIEALRREKNPLTEEVLIDLREEDCSSMIPTLKLCG